MGRVKTITQKRVQRKKGTKHKLGYRAKKNDKPGDITKHKSSIRIGWSPICTNVHLYHKEKSVPFVPKLFHSFSNLSNCEPTIYLKQKKTKQQNSDRRSRANVLRACQQRVGLYTKIRAGYRREARPLATLNQELKIVGLVVFGLLKIFGSNATNFLFWYKWDWFIILVLVNTHPEFKLINMKFKVENWADCW